MLSRIIVVPFVLAIILIGTNETKNADLSYTVKIKKLECSANPLLITNCTCKLKAISWSRSEAYTEVHLLKPITNASVRMELYKFTNQFRPFMLNITANICKWFESSGRESAYLKIFLNMIKKFSNVNHKCPYTGILRAEGVYFDPKMALVAIPGGTYKCVFTFYEGYPYEILGTVKYVVAVNYDTVSRDTINLYK